MNQQEKRDEIDEAMLLAQMETCGIGRDVVDDWLRQRATGQPSGHLESGSDRNDETVSPRGSGQKRIGR